MADALLVATVLAASTVVGYPACRLLPVRSGRDRLVAAPVIGFAIVSAVTILLYKLGLPPRASLWAICAMGTMASVVEIRRDRTALPVGAVAAVGGAAAAIVLLCLLPSWTGGASFKVFQGNVYDQFYSYLTGSVVFHRYSYATVMSADADPASNPVVVEAMQAALIRPVSIVHAAFWGTHATAVSGAYAFLVALQVNLFFSALFMALSVFKASLRTGIVVAGALTVGFFQQHVLDMDAWSELSTLPIYLLVVAVTALTGEFWSDGDHPRPFFWKLTLLYGVLLLPVTLIYPEAWGGYALAGGVALATLVRGPRPAWLSAALGISIASAASLVLSAWFGSLAYLKTSTQEALTAVEWWRYFQAYVLGPGAIAGGAAGHQAWPFLSTPWFVRPADAALGVIGLYWLLPGASVAVSPAVGAAWRVALYVFLFLLASAVTRTVIGTIQGTSRSNGGRALAACLAGLVVPTAFLAAGFFRTAGKALSIMAPLMFFLIAAPLLLRRHARRRDHVAAALFVAGYVFTGVLRVVLAATPGGTVMPGLPGSAHLLALQKSGMDWRMDRLAKELKGCDGLIIDVRQPLMNEAVQLVATDLAVPWGSTQAVRLPSVNGERIRPPYQPAGWAHSNCIAADDRSDLQVGRKVISVTSDDEAFRFLDAVSGTLEIGVTDHPGVVAQGAYDTERTPDGDLRWTSGQSTFRVANSSAAPARSLIISCWPIQSSSVILRISINGWIAFEGPVPHDPLAIPLARTAKDPRLNIELTASPLTHFPGDPRDLGVALRQLALQKGP